MACKIDTVFAENGQPSKLYRKLLDVTGDQRKAMETYLELDRMQFNEEQLDDNGEVILSEINEDILESYFNDVELMYVYDEHAHVSPQTRSTNVENNIRNYLQQAEENLKKQLNRDTEEQRRTEINRMIEELQDQREQLKQDSSTPETVEDIAGDHLVRIQDILNSDRPDLNDLLYAIQIAEMWDYSITQNFLTKSQKKSDNPYKKVLLDINGQFGSKYEDLIDKAYSLMTKEIQNEWEIYSDITVEEVKQMKDIGWTTANLLNLSNVDEPLVQLLRNKIIKANQQNGSYIQKKSQNLNRLLDDVDDPTFLLARDDSGEPIDDLIGVFDHRYYRETEDIVDRYLYLLSNSDVDDKTISRAQKKMFRQLDNFQRTIDMNKVLENEEAYRQELMEIYGKKDLVDFAINKAKERFEIYKRRRRSKREELEHKIHNNDVELKENQTEQQYIEENLNLFDLNYDPRRFVNQDVGVKSYTGYQHSYQIAKDPSMVNERFYSMSKSERALYDEVTNILMEAKQYLPDYVSRKVSKETFLPAVKAGLVEIFKEDGVRAAMKTAANNWFDEILGDINELEFRQQKVETEANPFTGVGGVVPVKYTKKVETEEGNPDAIYEEGAIYSKGTLVKKGNKYYKSLVDDNSLDVTEQGWKEIESNNYTKNVVAATKAFMYMSFMYKQLNKVSIEADLILKMVGEAQTVEDGRVVKDQGPVRLKERIINEIKHQIYGDRRDSEYEADQFFGFLTSVNPKEHYKNVTRKREIENERDELYTQLDNGDIDQQEFSKRLLELKEEYKNLGGRSLIWGNLIDSTLLKFTQIKGMGYNLMAAVRNVIHGFHATMVHAAGDQEFNEQDVLNSLGTILSELSGGTTNAKFLNIIKRFDILHTVDEVEFNKDRESSGKGWFVFQNWTEKLGQGISTVAAMKSRKIQDKEGNTRNLYEAYDNDGNWKTEEFGEQQEWQYGTPDREVGQEFSRFQIMIKQLNGQLHGDFASTSTHPFKRHLIGRAVSMFKTYLPEIIKYRFGQKTYDAELRRSKEGIHRSLAMNAMTKPKDVFNIAWTEAIPGVGRLQDSELTIDAGDAANIRRSLRELRVMMYLALVGLILKSLWDEEEDWKKIYIANQILRIDQDIQSYVDPNTGLNIAKDPLVLMGTITQAQGVLTSSHRQLFDEEYQGDHPLWKTAKLMPISSQITSMSYQAGQIIE